MPGGTGQAAWKPAALATAAGVAIFVFGITVESLIIRAVHGNRAELEWLSDAAVSMAVTGMTYLWLRLRRSRRRVLALEQEQIAIDEQLRLAAEIQRGLLPDLPQATPGFRWAARMIPASRVGGDFYDFVQPAAGTVLAIVGDVSGKGIPAATYATANVELRPGDFGVLVTDGMTEALEAGPMTLGQVLEASAKRLAAGRSPAAFCHDLLRAAAAGPGPVGVSDWQDDRTVFVFAVEAPP